MKKPSFKSRYQTTVPLVVFPVMLLCAGCSYAPSVLDPRGFAATQISELSWILIGLGTLVYVGVIGFLLLALFKRRQKNNQQSDRESDRENNDTTENGGNPAHGRGIVVWGGIVMPAVVLLIVFGLTLNTLMALSAPSRADEITINVVGHQWWWEVVYPDHGVVTANEIHIPVGQSVRINLTAAGVIHSFWVPQLHGKLDMVPGHTNTLRIQADEPGEYRGICAEFCGIQHARMLFLVVADPPDEFATWLAEQSAPAAELAQGPAHESARQGRAIFLSSTCAQCHAIAGTEAAGRLGPDLTHLASRREIAAGMLENNRGNLAGWIIGPQELKPGNLMPATDLSGAELQALLDYLATLK